MGLHGHPRIHKMDVLRSTAPSPPTAVNLQTTLTELRPSMVLVMGRIAALAVLERSEPLGQLRGQVHPLHGVPLVVTFDAPYLLRVQADKARAWADMCLALQVVQNGAAA